MALAPLRSLIGAISSLRLKLCPNVHATLLTRIGKPHLLSRVGGLELLVNTTGKLLPIDGQARLHHLCRKIATIGKKAFRNCSTVGVSFEDHRMNRLAFAQFVQSPLGLLSIGMIEFRCIDAKKPDLGFSDYYRIAVNDVCFPAQRRLPRRRSCCFWRKRSWYAGCAPRRWRCCSFRIGSWFSGRVPGRSVPRCFVGPRCAGSPNHDYDYNEPRKGNYNLHFFDFSAFSLEVVFAFSETIGARL